MYPAMCVSAVSLVWVVIRSCLLCWVMVVVEIVNGALEMFSWTKGLH